MCSKLLSSDYVVEIDGFTRAQWSEILDQFNDATIYQTFSYGMVRWSEKNISHIIIKQNNIIRAAAQLRIIILPLIGSGIAYLPEGPLWCRRDNTSDRDDLIAIMNALINEYVKKRGLYLRVIPSIIDDVDSGVIINTLEEIGLRHQNSVSSYRTFLLDLSLPIEEIRKGLRRNWRGHLNKAEKNGLQVYEGDTADLYTKFTDIYKEMIKRKQFKEYVDIEEYRDIQKNLEGSDKMRIFVCEFEGQPVSAIVVSAHGNKGIYILGATSNKGMKLKGSYLLQWRAIEWLKESKYKWYDLGGIDHLENKGTYDFKAGLAGKTGKDVSQIGQFDIAPNYFTKIIIMSADKVRRFLQ